MGHAAHPRWIRSFVTRSGRTGGARERALGVRWPKYGVAFATQPLEPRALFGRDAPLTIEIGFGNGENLLALASAHPARDFLGIEVHRPGIGRLLLGLEERQLANVRVICHDAVEVLERQVAAQSVDEFLILFPDPWPKKRHHKRRLLQRPFAELLSSRLARGGLLRLGPHWAPYAPPMLEVLAAPPRPMNVAADGAFVPRPPERAPTRFERRGERLGHDGWDLALSRSLASIHPWAH